MEFKDRLKELIEEKTEGSQKKLSLETNIPASTINCWFTKDIKPTYVQIVKLAQYFEVSTDYLLGLEDDFGVRTAAPMHDTEHYSEEEKRLIEDYRALNYYGKKLVKQTFETLKATSVQSGQKKNIIS